ncbi:MAG TPA: hypothetical protein VLA49_03185 [Anaerolineales bacterium]|nr:hypothetical protein [Anaerolineales bacterium]
MDIFFSDPTAIPLPPDEVRVKELRAEPWPDKRRVRVYLEITPFQQRPNGNITITDAAGEEVASVSFIETIDPKMEFTIHLRRQETSGEYSVSATLFYEENTGTQDDQVIPPSELKQTVVDQAVTNFSI